MLCSFFMKWHEDIGNILLALVELISQTFPLQEELMKNQVSLEWRDFCSGLLIPLNKCRRDNFFLPWKCGHERHEYEKCQYFQYKSRLLKPEH